MTNAELYTKLLRRPEDPAYDEQIRQFQGCPTLTVTHGGRIYLAWYSGGTIEPHIQNYNLLICSDDQGKTWSKPLLVIPSQEDKLIHALDIQLWTAPDGRLFVFWVQNNVEPAPDKRPDFGGKPGVIVEGYMFRDFRHAAWMTVCENPDADEPQFSEPRMWDCGFLRCKPLVCSDGSWLLFNYNQMTDRYAYSISRDEGKTFVHCEGAEKLATPFDEAMAYQKYDGSVRMLARTKLGELAESTSFDGGLTWTEAKLSGIDSPNTRFYIARTPGGRILLINNDHRESRTNMTVYLSEDDGVTWKYKRLIDSRASLSYPDADFHDGRIYLTYDRERTGAKEILFLSFTEEDIMNESYEFTPVVVSKP